MIQDFSSLHGHSHFSVFDGLSTPEENVKSAKEKGLRSIALTDHGICHGHADHYLAGKKHGVRVIFGVEAYVIHDLIEWTRLKQEYELQKKRKGDSIDKIDVDADDLGKIDGKLLRRKGHLVILACNRKGLANLNQLVFRAHKEGFYGKPRMDKRMLAEHAEGLVASSACMGGVVSKRCWDFKEGHIGWDEVVREVREFDAIFGRGRFFLEIQLNEHEGQRFINECMIRLSTETGVPLTVTTDFHYSKEDEWEPRELLHLLSWNKTVKDFPNGKIDTEIKQLYVKSAEEMWQTYQSYGKSHIPEKIIIEAFGNTLLIDSLVDDFEPDTHQRLPTLPFQNPFKEMGLRAIDGLKKLGLADNDEYKARLLHELGVIKEKGIANYFLIVQQIITEAKKDMLVGAGRGSAAGSLVCYALGITDLDPIHHGLMFERFLDPARLELPDIDVDFQDGDAAKEMLKRMFGNDNVAALSTYGTFQIKGLLKDLGRVYDVDHNEINKINKKIESELRVLYVGQDKSTIVIKLEDIERVSKSFNEFVGRYPQVGQHLKKLYGRNRHVGRHACGVIIGDNLPAETAVFSSKGVVQASFTEGIVNKNISAMGFVKFDILNLATLRVIDYALRLISQRTGRPYEELKESMRPHNLDLDDPKVLRHVFWNGNFAGVFQFTEKGIRRLAQRVKPDTFVDVSAITSIYRPGPLGGGFDRMYVHNKHNPDDVKYDHPLLENILSKTRGCIVFQEQLMQVCNVLGKMTMKDVNRVRKVLLKKDKSKSDEFLKAEGDELRGKFVVGCGENGYTEKPALELWEKLLKFGGYGFNKAHSDCYSVCTMQCAHLATYHPLEFYAATLTVAQSGDMQEYVSDIKRCGIKILPIDINASKAYHSIEGDALRLSLSSVLGVGPAAIEKIVAAQPYADFMDYLDRSGVGKTATAPLMMVGAFDSIMSDPNMRRLEWFYERYTADPKLKQKKRRQELDDLFARVSRPDIIPPANEIEKGVPLDDYALHEKVFFENSLMGFSTRGSPFEILDRQQKIEAMFGNVALDYKEFMDGEEEVGILPVVVKDFKERPQRNGQMFAFIKFAVQSGEEFEAPAFATTWKHIAPLIRKGSVYITTFNRKEDAMDSLIVGRPGFAQTSHSVQQAFINVDSVTL